MAALPEHQSLFKKVSHNSQLEDRFVSCNPEIISIEDLQKKSWEILGPRLESKIDTLIEDYSNAKVKSLGSDDIKEIAMASVGGQVEQLIIEAEKQIGGQLDVVSGKVAFKELADPSTDDLLDDLAQMVLKMGGQVLVLSNDKMPTESGIAAIFRFKSGIEEVPKDNSGTDSSSKNAAVTSKLEKQRAANEGMIKLK